MYAACRTAVVLCALLLATAGARPAEDKAADPGSESFGLTTDPRAALQLKAAADYVKDGDWKSALRLLQHQLDGETDVLVRMDGRYVRARDEAERLLSSLPAAGREVYQQTYGPRAAELLKQLRQTGDAPLGERIVRRYLYTDVGPSALQELARLHYKAGRPREAARCYAKLLTHLGPDRWTTDDLYEAAIAFRKQNTSAYAERIRKLLLARVRQDVIQLGQRKLTVEELRKEIDRKAPPRQPSDWPMFGGDVARSARGIGGAPFLSPTWRKPMIYYEDRESAAASEFVKNAAKWVTERNQPILPSFSPLVVTMTGGRKEVPLLIYKNYWGAVARDLKSGEVVWAAPSSWSLERMLHVRIEMRKQQAMNEWLRFYVTSNQQPQILWENSTVSTLSTDGQFVYAVEDLAVPPPGGDNMNMGFPNGGNNNAGYGFDLQDAITHSRLQAFNLAQGGKLSWELGGGAAKGPLSDCYFLGPPLPLDGLLYLLVDKQQELRLVCIDPNVLARERNVPNAVVRSSLTLAAAPEKMRNDVLRRTNAAPIAYGEGILVCPTNAGIVCGVDLVSNHLVWAYPYRDKSDQPPRQLLDRFGRPSRRGINLIGPDGRVISSPLRSKQWKDSAPIISDGKVVFTPPDASSIHCLNLRDGSPLWSRKKKDDEVYLGGVYDGNVLIVGKTSVEALSLAGGRSPWTVDTGMPSGRGIAAGDVYYLPLREAIGSKRPEICAIDIRKGQVSAHIRSRPRTVGGDDFDAPGNLLLAGGKLVSLSLQEIAVYPSLAAKLGEIDKRIGDNPNDPVGLTERGELRRDNGDLAGAVADLQSALKNNPDERTRRRARSLLFDTLTQMFQHDLHDAEKHLKEYEGLCAVEGKGASPEEEQKRRRVTFYLLVARLRESQDRPKDALNAYLDLLALGPAEDLVSPPGERGVKVRRDVWIRGRIDELLKRAKPEQRKQLEEEMRRRLKDARSRDDVESLRDFAALFGDGAAAGREARLLLAERLMRQRAFLEAELYLQPLRGRADDPIRAARALEMLGRLMIHRGLPADAVSYYRLLRREQGKTVLPGGQTGAEVWDTLSTDKRLLPFLDLDDVFAAPLRARKEEGTFPANAPVFPFEQEGEDMPFFRQHTLGAGLRDDRLQLLDRRTGEERWGFALSPTSIRALVAGVGAKSPPRFSYHTRGHLVVVAAASVVLGVDPVAHRVLWRKDTLPVEKGVGPNYAAPRWSLILPDPHDDGTRIAYPDGWVQYLGQDLVVSPSAACLATRQGLQAFEALTGQLRWTRPDVVGRLRIFGDEEHVFVVEEREDGVPVSTRAYRLTDGGTVPAPPFAALFARRRQVFGRTLVLSDKDDKEAVTLRLYDIPTGADVWKATYPPKSLVLHSEEPHLTGAVEPDGKVHVIDLRRGKEVMTGQMGDASNQLRGVKAIHLLADPKHFYLAFQTEREVNSPRTGGGGLEWESNVVANLGMRALPVNGPFYAFEREGGAVSWQVLARDTFVVLDQFRELPVVLFTARHKELKNNGPGVQRLVQSVSALSIEKRSGKILFISENLAGASSFYAVRLDPQAGTIEFVSPLVKIVHSPK